MRLSRITLILSLAIAAIGACSGEDSSGGGVTTGPDESRSRFLILASQSWTLKEAVKSRAGPGPLAHVEPSLDWWAEYERFVPVTGGVEGLDLRISGHRASQSDHRNEVRGFHLTPATFDDQQSLEGVSPDGKPAVITIAPGDRYTIMLLSHALSLDELRQLGADLTPADEAQWVAAGGTIVDCLPSDPACPSGPGG